VHIYLSPHLDDGPLSCGGRIAEQVAAGEHVRVVNIFAAVPEYTRLSAFAAHLHNAWGEPIDPVGMRRAEDGRVMQRLGADSEYWEYCDCIYRSSGGAFLYTTNAEVFGPIHPTEHSLVAGLSARVHRIVESNSRTTLYVPLGVGGHVDHIVVRTAALALSSMRARIVLYEEFPYALESGAVQAAREALGHRLTSEQVPIDAEVKSRILSEYRTQVRALFGDAASLRSKVCTYAASLGHGGRYFERYWRIEHDD
jgi:LmbE family N-acetylglucosaminyl deacetylase